MTAALARAYRPPFGVPIRWNNEQSGELKRAVGAYLCKTDMTARQLAVMREYLDYYISAPCWDDPSGFDVELRSLRSKVKILSCRIAIERWIKEALEIALDPL
jgi:hypothetical protein